MEKNPKRSVTDTSTSTGLNRFLTILNIFINIVHLNKAPRRIIRPKKINDGCLFSLSEKLKCGVIFFVGQFFLGGWWLLSPKIVINLLGTYEKLPS